MIVLIYFSNIQLLKAPHKKKALCIVRHASKLKYSYKIMHVIKTHLKIHTTYIFSKRNM